MMDSSSDFHRPHRTSSINSSSSTTAPTATSELFICFTSRLSSSSSMKLSSSKSILSPARARDAPPPPQISLSSSLSRRLKSNGSLKGGQASPMFPSGGKKRGGAGFENPEPSSPKVTCIGQVRVKTKKQGKKLRARSKRKGEMSFKKLELSRSGHHSFPPQQPLNGSRNQRWVHFPVTICEALRTFGADWNCFLPCRSSCMSSKEEKAVAVPARSNGGGGDGGSSCGEVIDRWLVAVHEAECMERREIELVVGGEEITEETYERSCSRRRHVFEGIEFNEDEICRERKEAEEEEEQGRVSICIPPKNALLLMRCRSDPVKMAALAKRFCGSPVQKDEEDEDKDYEDCQDSNDNEKVVEEVEIEEIKDSNVELSEECWATAEARKEQRIAEGESSSLVGEEEDAEEEGERELDEQIVAMVPEELVDKPEKKEEEERVEIMSDPGTESPQAHENEDNSVEEEEEEAGATKIELLSENNNDGVDLDDELASTLLKLEMEVEEAERRDAETIVMEKASPEIEGRTQEMACESGSEPEPGYFNPAVESKGRDSVDREPAGLPDCLLLMMCEPKLSMEVSKETWVCSTDFIRWLPERHVKKAAAGGDDPKKRAPNTKRSGSALTAQQTRILQQPPRSSCSFPSQAAAVAAAVGAAGRGGGESMATMIEQKLLSTKPGEPLALTRCKSEPMRTATKLASDACFWKNRKLEPHRQSADLRVKAAGVGF